METFQNLFLALKNPFLYACVSVPLWALIVKFDLGETIENISGLFCLLGPIGYYFLEFNRLQKSSKYSKEGITRYVPLFYYLEDIEKKSSYKESIGLIGKNELIICNGEKYIAHDVSNDFWSHVGSEIFRLPYSSIVDIGVISRDKSEYSSDKGSAFFAELLVNNTLGKAIGFSGTTIIFAGFLYIIYMTTTGEASLVFAVSNKTSGSPTLALIGSKLPGGVAKTIDITGGVMDFIEIFESDRKEIKAAKAVRNEIMSEVLKWQNMK